MGSIFILGAGFSHHAGLPLGKELFPLVIEEAKRRRLWEGIIQPDIDAYLYYQEHVKGNVLEEDEIDYEDFISFLDYEHFLGLRGTDTWSPEGNRSQLAIRNLVAYILHEKQKQIEPGDLDLYLRFADHLELGDYIYTFNYDTLLETVLSQKNKPFRLFPQRLKTVHAGDAEVEYEVREVVLLKVHGSIDWFDISSFESSQRYAQAQRYYFRAPHAVFGDPSLFNPEKIVLGPCWPDSPLQKIYRIHDLDKYFASVSFFFETPLIIAPSLSKTIYLHPVKEFWRGFSKAGVFNSRVAIIGFSMPFHDDYILQPMYHLISNFQHVTDSPKGMNRARLKMVDYRQTDADIESYKDRYRFVEWDRADVHFDGFNTEAIEMIFSTP